MKTASEGRWVMVASWRVISALALVLSLAACASGRTPSPTTGVGTYKVGSPYRINGKLYLPKEDPNYSEIGIASWYGPGFHGQRTANGEIYDMNSMTAAHTTLPMPTLVRVTNLENRRSVIVRVNDRGPFVNGRIIDLSKRAATELGFKDKGVARVRVEYVGRADANSSFADNRAPSRAPVQMAAAQPAPSPVRAPPLTPSLAPAPAPSPVRAASSVVAAPPAQTAAFVPAPRPAPRLTSVSIASAALDARIAPSHQSASGPATVAAGHQAASAPRRLFVQLGAFSDPERALALFSGLEGRSDVTIASAPQNNEMMYRVRVGPFQNENEAMTTLALLQDLGHRNAQIVRD